MPLKYSKDFPTTPGYYWTRPVNDPSFEEIEYITTITKVNGFLYATVDDGPGYWNDERMEYAGPIPAPEE